MKSSYDMEFCDGLRVTGCGGLKGLFQGHGVGAGGIFLAAEGAQAAGRDAHVRRIDMAIDVEVGPCRHGCARERELASHPTARMSPVRESARASSALSRVPAITFS